MPRPQRELDPGGGPLVEFARELRALRAAAGTPKFAAMSRRTGRSKTALADAAGGRHLPRWETVEDFVRACDGDPATWRDRWERVRVGIASADAAWSDSSPTPPDPAVGPAAGTPTVDGTPEIDGTPNTDDTVPDLDEATPPEPAPAASGPPSPPVEPPPTLSPPTVSPPADGSPRPGRIVPTPRVAPRRSFRVGMLLGVLVGGAVVVAAVGVASALQRPAVVTQNLRVIEVQNKVAIGPDSLVEDRTPAYLSSVPIAYCAAPGRSCKVPGTEMGSGADIVANCQIVGQRMVNFDLKEVASRTNPYRADSEIWYRASFPDGRSGYLSEVYVDGADRGGLGLPTCGPAPTEVGVRPVAGG